MLNSDLDPPQFGFEKQSNSSDRPNYSCNSHGNCSGSLPWISVRWIHPALGFSAVVHPYSSGGPNDNNDEEGNMHWFVAYLSSLGTKIVKAGKIIFFSVRIILLIYIHLQSYSFYYHWYLKIFNTLIKYWQSRMSMPTSICKGQKYNTICRCVLFFFFFLHWEQWKDNKHISSRAEAQPQTFSWQG